MAGNSERRGAVRKGGSKKVASAGTGGKNRRSLEGRGPTPKAEDREYHPAHKAKLAAERRAVAGTLRVSGHVQFSIRVEPSRPLSRGSALVSVVGVGTRGE